MRIVFAALLVVALASSAFAVNSQTWNFDDNTTQGWSVAMGPYPGVNAPGIGNPNPWTWTDTANGKFNVGTYNSLALWLPDQRFAYIAAPFGATNSFTFTALVGYNFNGGANRLQNAGMGYNVDPSDPAHVSAYFEGKASGSSSMMFRDYNAVGSAAQEQSGVIKNSAGSTPAQQAVWLTIDYNHDVAGKVILKCQGENHLTYIEAGLQSGFGVASPQSWAYNKALGTDPGTGQIFAVTSLRLGGDGSWTQMYVDNVTFTDYSAVPEPGGLLALGGGLVTLLGAFRRRR